MKPYIGRFAPSPTGPLHFGSLVAALASYCDAKAHQGLWLVRMEDLDKPREIKGAASQILRTLESFGFDWDGEIMWQSQRNEAYQTALDLLGKQGLIYPCTCSRKEITDSSSARGIEGAIYPKTCLHHSLKNGAQPAYRLKTEDKLTVFCDRIQGEVQQNIAKDIGDFVLRRADTLFAYQLAVVVDDAAQGITHVVRGADLLHSTPRQIFLQTLLSLPQPSYAHIPVVCNSQGEKLSKQTLAQKVEPQEASLLLTQALKFLAQPCPENLKNATPKEVLAWAVSNWRLELIPRALSSQALN